MLVYDVKIGETVDIRERAGDLFCSMRIAHKSGQAVRLVFDMPRALLIRVTKHRENGINFGLTGEPRAPLSLNAGVRESP